jgi:acetyl esterase/lipase
MTNLVSTKVRRVVSVSVERDQRNDQRLWCAVLDAIRGPARSTTSAAPATVPDVDEVVVGSHEILLSDALRLAERAALSDVAVTLDVTPGVPHVFQGFAGLLDEAGAALDRATAFVRAQLRTPVR